ncbi:spermatogenesis-associated protein 7 isoform X2 [Saccopteryx leptura]|uniref:spermatogenesis-associated protein 7 isoform X2 n=1 Tax=Saccopteryx leptura TaxID=249018 RepID=UPI00339D1C79
MAAEEEAPSPDRDRAAFTTSMAPGNRSQIWSLESDLAQPPALRRVSTAPVLPRSAPPYPFKGHLSTKSNAVVDCSVPLSMSTSIKYADQQRREKLKKELAQCGRQLKLTRTTVQANAKSNSKSLLNTLQKPTEESQNEDDMVIREVSECSSFTRSPVASSERLHLSLPRSDQVRTAGTENLSSFLSRGNHAAAGPRRTCWGTSQGRGPRGSPPNPHRFQVVISKAASADLLDKHSELFTDRHLPFTPRTLKTEAKSFLSQYRYYTPAKRKKYFTDQRMEAETQTELSSFASDFETVETKDCTDPGVKIKQASNCVPCGTKENVTRLPSQGAGVPWAEGTGVALRCFPASEEELLYLSFIENITDEILNLGLFSNRSLERLFERHIRQNKHRLEEGKMRSLLHVLKVNLGCTSKENSADPDDIDMLSLLDFEKAENSKQSEQDAVFRQERQEYRKALDLLLSAPKDENATFFQNDFFLPVYKSKHSEGVIIQQVHDETNQGPSAGGENNPSISDSLLDQETFVTVIEGDSDTEKGETSSDSCVLSTALSQSAQLCSVTDDSMHDMEGPILKIMDMSIEDCPSDV